MKPCFAIRRYDDRRGPRTVAEEIDWLDVAGVIIAATFVKREPMAVFEKQRTVAIIVFARVVAKSSYLDRVENPG